MPKSPRLRVYVAGPYSADNVIDVLANIRKGQKSAYELLKAGFAPFCPWLDYQLSFYGEITIEEYRDYSIAWLDGSEAVFVLPGWEKSSGTKAEMARAKELGIPIFFNKKDLYEWAEKRRASHE